jgi:beta-barrel assembly-enhancing protease
VILDRAGYDSAALVNMLEVMDTRLTPGGPDFARTHPSPSSRIRDIRPALPAARASDPALRQQRFLAALHRV